MLINLRTVHKPRTIEEAAQMLKTPGVYPLYGGGASLVRSEADNRKIEEAVDLTAVLSAGCSIEQNIELGGCATLETIRAFWEDRPGAVILKAEAPLTLRNTLTLGDTLLECHADSLLLALLFGFDAMLRIPGSQLMPLDQWFNLSAEERRATVIESILFSRDYFGSALVAFEKVSRTPSDTPLVAALAIRRQSDAEPRIVVTGIADRPVIYRDGAQSQISDYKGSTEYRTEMAKVLSERAIKKLTGA
jgi:CO/xanthine dehydrogenase FAD-binding subunit